MGSVGEVGSIKTEKLTYDNRQSEIIDEIIELYSNKKYSSLELTRMCSDLDVVKNRLVSGEYLQSNFKPRNMLSIPDRTDEIFKDLTFYWSVAQIWKELIKRAFDTKQFNAAEIGCGHIPKVGLGLIYSGFIGRLDLIDIDLASSLRAKEFLSLIGANFKVKYTATSIFDEQEKYDALFANHLLDDLILSEYCLEAGVESQVLYQDEILYRQAWEEIVAKQSFIPELMEKLAISLLSQLNLGGKIILLDYASFSHKALGLTSVIETVKKAQNLLNAKFELLGACSLPLLSDVILSFDRLKVSSSDILCFSRSKDRGLK